MQNQLLCDVENKRKAIEDLQNSLYSLECEVDFLSRQNANLCCKLQQTGNSQGCAKEQTRGSCGKGLKGLQCKVEDFSESTKSLEQQVCNISSYLKDMRNQLTEVQAEREKLNKCKKIMLVCPPPTCPMPPPSCDGWKPPTCPRRCSFRGNIPTPKTEIPREKNYEQKSGKFGSIVKQFFASFGKSKQTK